MRREHAFQLLGVVLVSSALVAGAANIFRITRDAWQLRKFSRDARREHVFPALFTAVHRIERDLPSPETVTILMRTPRDVDGAVFLTYYLYPRPTKYCWSLDQYRFEAKRPLETPLAYADLSHADAARVMTYAQIRDEQIRDTAPLAEPLSEDASQDFTVPFVAAIDGAPGDDYMTQADFLPGGDGSLSLTLQPSGKTASSPLHADQRVVLRDVVYETFGVLTSGWLHVTATTPVHAGVWLINRGRENHVGVPLFSTLPVTPQHLAAGDRLWVLNTEDVGKRVVVNRTPVEIPPRGLVSFDSAPQTNEVAGAAHVLAFTSRKLPDGNTHFEWPEGR